MTIQDALEEESILITAEDAFIKLSIKNLLNKKKQIFKKIKLNNFKINVNLEKYKNNKFKNINLLPITFIKGSINLLNGKETLATISEVFQFLLLIEGTLSLLPSQYQLN